MSAESARRAIGLAIEIEAPGAGSRRAAEVDREDRDAADRAARLAATYGHCGTCATFVSADGVHAWNCTAVPTSRRANDGRES